MTTKQIADFLKSNIEPLEDEIYGDGYRASAYLKDGTYLPCVIFRNPTKKLKLAIKRFDETRSRDFPQSSGFGYLETVEAFVISGNRVNDYDIDKVEKSPYAFSRSILEKIQGETTMSWTGFAAKMKDGKIFGFGTSFLMEFFNLPKGYVSEDIIEIFNHSYVLDDGSLRKHRAPFSELSKDYDRAVVFRERPYFECGLKEL